MVSSIVSLFFLSSVFLKALSDIQIAVKMVRNSEDSDEHPLDRQYHSLRCQLQSLDSGCNEYKVCVWQFIAVIMMKVEVYQSALQQCYSVYGCTLRTYMVHSLSNQATEIVSQKSNEKSQD